MTNPRPNIVVVDDDAGMNEALERLLNAAGFHTTAFSSAEELLEARAADRADCLILDVHLPGLSGYELHQRLRQSGSETPVIFITAYEDPASHLHAQGAGVVACLTKPFAGQTLVAAIRRAIRPPSSETSQ